MKQTIHKIWNVYKESTSFRVVVSQDSVVHKIPSEAIGDIDNDAFRSNSVGGLCDVGGKAVDNGFCAGWVALGYTPSETGRARHFGVS